MLDFNLSSNIAILLNLNYYCIKKYEHRNTVHNIIQNYYSGRELN